MIICSSAHAYLKQTAKKFENILYADILKKIESKSFSTSETSEYQALHTYTYVHIFCDLEITKQRNIDPLCHPWSKYDTQLENNGSNKKHNTFVCIIHTYMLTSLLARNVNKSQLWPNTR